MWFWHNLHHCEDLASTLLGTTITLRRFGMYMGQDLVHIVLYRLR